MSFPLHGLLLFWNDSERHVKFISGGSHLGNTIAVDDEPIDVAVGRPLSGVEVIPTSGVVTSIFRVIYAYN
jgi:hypothetical protein